MEHNSFVEPPASIIKDIPDQHVLANGQKSPSRSRAKVTLASTKPLKRSGNMSPDLTVRGGRNRSHTMSMSASSIVLQPPIPEPRGRRERSNSEPSQPVWLTLDGIWDDAEANWQEVCSQKGRLMNLLYKKGVPSNRRVRLWAKISFLIPNTDLLKCSQEEVEGPSHRCIYKRLLDLRDTQHEQQIRADITRTFPSEESIYAPEFQLSLFNVLKGFSLYDEEVGYCQGLNFVAALILMQIPEEKAFFMLIRLLKGHNLRSFYTVDMKGVRLRMYQMDKITQTLFPRLYSHMEQLGVTVSVVTTPWFMTAFGYQLPVDVALRVMDALLYEGIPALFRVALAILVLCEEEIMVLNVDEVMDYFRSDLRAKFQDPQQLMNTAYAVNVSATQLETLELEFLANEAAATKVESEFNKSSEEEEAANRNTLMYSQVLVDSHETKEKLYCKSTEFENLSREFEAFKKKAENEKVALVARLGESLDKISAVEAENEFLALMLSRTEKDLRHVKVACNQLSDCNIILAEELYKQKSGTSPRATISVSAVARSI